MLAIILHVLNSNAICKQWYSIDVCIFTVIFTRQDQVYWKVILSLTYNKFKTMLIQLKWRDTEIAPPSNNCPLCITKETYWIDVHVYLFVWEHAHLFIGFNCYAYLILPISSSLNGYTPKLKSRYFCFLQLYRFIEHLLSMMIDWFTCAIKCFP